MPDGGGTLRGPVAPARVLTLLAAFLLLADAGVALSQQNDTGPWGIGPLSALQMVPATPLSAMSEPRRTFKPPKIEKRVESTDLGFEQSVAPGPGRKVTFQGRQYQVAQVEVEGGGPMLLANHYVIGVLGSRLIVSLKEVDPFEDLTN